MWRLIVPVVLLASCSQPSASQKAEEDYQFISEHGASPQDLCDAKRAIADAYRKERNAEKYDLAKLTADISCRRAAQIAAGY